MRLRIIANERSVLISSAFVGDLFCVCWADLPQLAASTFPYLRCLFDRCNKLTSQSFILNLLVLLLLLEHDEVINRSRQ